jgi:hypothetical protein
LQEVSDEVFFAIYLTRYLLQGLAQDLILMSGDAQRTK